MERLVENVAANSGAFSPSVTTKAEVRPQALSGVVAAARIPPHVPPPPLHYDDL